MKKKHFPDFLKAYLEWNKDTEAPTSYHEWVGLAVLGAAVGRNFRLRYTTYDLYPNVFVLLVGPPATTRKTTALSFGKGLLKELVGVNICADAISKQQMTASMAEMYDSDSDETNYVIFSGELSDLLSVSQTQMTHFLLTIYTEYDEYQYHIKGNDDIEITTNPYVTFLGATTPAYLAHDFPGTLAEDGFTSRTTMVYERYRTKDKPFVTDEELEWREERKKELVSDLKLFRKESLGQEMIYDKKGQALFEELYPSGKKGERDDNNTSSRKDVHLHKVSMLCAISRGSNKIQVKDIRRANDMIERTELKLPDILRLIGNNPHTSVQYLIEEYVEREGKATEKTLWKKFQKDITYPELVAILDGCLRSGVFYQTERGGPYYYRKKLY